MKVVVLVLDSTILVFILDVFSRVDDKIFVNAKRKGEGEAGTGRNFANGVAMMVVINRLREDRKCCDEIRKRKGETNVYGSWSNERDKAYLIKREANESLLVSEPRALVGNETRALKS